jgi:5-methylcytosine-specific restriction endonuclease McrA
MKEIELAWCKILTKLCERHRRQVQRAQAFHPTPALSIDPWAQRLRWIIEKQARCRQNRGTLWSKKLDSLTHSWNTWHYQLKGQRTTLLKKKQTCIDWHNCLVVARRRFEAKARKDSWFPRLSCLCRAWTDRGKQIKGGIGNMNPQIKNERIGITDLRTLLDTQGFRCALSGRPLTPSNCSLDHIIPLSRGGAHTLDNVQIVRDEVNRAKGQMTDDELFGLCVDIGKHKDLFK